MSQDIREKLVQYFNEALAMENAAEDRNRQRIEETPLPLTRQQLQYHLEETLLQQERLRKIILSLGGGPTSAKASLPMLLLSNMETLSNTVKEAAKSVASDSGKRAVAAEKELMQSKQDAIIENAEITSYKILIQMAEETGHKDVIPDLNKSLQEEVSMSNFIMGNSPLVLRMLLPKAAEIGTSQEDMKRAASA